MSQIGRLIDPKPASMEAHRVQHGRNLCSDGSAARAQGSYNQAMKDIERLIDCLKSRFRNKLPVGFASWEAFVANMLGPHLGWESRPDGNAHRVRAWIEGTDKPDREEASKIALLIKFWGKKTK
jgi:hypothetical protein